MRRRRGRIELAGDGPLYLINSAVINTVMSTVTSTVMSIIIIFHE